MYKVPLEKPQPDIDTFVRVIKGESIPTRGVVMEYLVDEEVRRQISVELLGLDWPMSLEDKDVRKKYLRNYIEFWERMGYDYVRFELNVGFVMRYREAPDTGLLSKRVRKWTEEKKGIIASWKNFESYRWPQVKEFDFFPYEFVSKNLPDGMGFFVSHGGGILENVIQLMGYEHLCYSLYDNPDLIEALFDKVGRIIYEFYRYIVELPNVYGFFQGDDMGFKSATLISPRILRQYVLPWHKKYAELAHQHSMLYLLHSCGNVEAIMDDLIEDVGIDGKHSFEDGIMPVSIFYKKYSDRIATLGGIDIDVLATYQEDELRRYIKKILTTCMKKGRYALGSGSSIPNYVPIKNYLIMLEEGLSFEIP